jgi:hypothetical protein
MVNYCAVLYMYVELGLETMIFFIDEINLGLEFIHNFVVLFLMVLHCQLIVILATLV